MSQYLHRNQQSHFADKHPPLNYLDADRERCWDANFLNSDWVRWLNEENEKAFRASVISRHPDIKEPQQMEKKTRDLGSKLQAYVKEMENRNKIVEVFMLHLRWHPLTHLGITEDEAREIDKKGVWQQQTEEMHDLCQDLRENWAWEYLWRSWYLMSTFSMALTVGIIQQDGFSGQERCTQKCPSFIRTLLLKALGLSRKAGTFAKAVVQNQSCLLI